MDIVGNIPASCVKYCFELVEFIRTDVQDKDEDSKLYSETQYISVKNTNKTNSFLNKQFNYNTLQNTK